MLHRLLETRDHWPATLRLILLGGAAAPPELIERGNALPRKLSMVNDQLPMVNEGMLTIDDWQLAIDNSPIVAPTYGLTEAASQVATMPPAEAARKPGSVGKPLLFSEVRIVDEAGEETPPGEVGEIVVTGPTVMRGYLNDQQSTENSQQATAAPKSEIPNQKSTIHTGDMGYLDEEGDLWVVQRRSDLIVSGGENVYPAEVEAVLRAHPAVAAACVVGTPDPEWGQRAAAMVAVGDDTAVTPADLDQFCRERLAGYKRPRQWRLVPALPLTASGKIARGEVQQRMAEDE
jgi:O-succinylbenzoic acid--CoA ligase